MKLFKIFKRNKNKPFLPVHQKIDFKLFYNLSPDVVGEVVRNAEGRFDSTVNDINRVKDISYKLLTVFIALISILITLYFNDNIPIGWGDKKVFSLLFFINIVIVLYCIYQLVSIAIPRDIMLKGEEPLKVGYNELFSLDHSEQNLNWNYGTIHALQDKIDHNEQIIETLNNRLEKIIIISTSTFFFTLILSLISKLF